MISAEFASNEQWDDAFTSMSVMVQPWRWNQGREVEEVRKWLASEFKTKTSHVHLFLSGRAGLDHVIDAIGLKSGDEIIVTGFTCEAVVLPLLRRDIHISYADITDLDYSSNLHTTRGRVSNKTKCLLIQHTFGIPPQRDQLLKLAQQHNLVVIEDIAHGWSRGVFDNQKYPTIKLLSFGRSKSLSSVFGGAIISSTKEQSITLNDVEHRLCYPSFSTLLRLLLYKPYAVLVKELYNTAQIGKILHKLFTSVQLIIPEITVQEKRGEYDPFFDTRFPNALAVLLLHQIKKLKHTEKKRRDSTRIYRDTLNGKIPDGLALARFPVLVTDRQALLEEARRYSMYFGKWYTQPVAPGEINLDLMKYPAGSCPTAEHICEHIVNLPTNITREQAEDIVQIVKPYLLPA